MTDYYDELKLSSSLDTAALHQELNKLESLWRRREVTNPEKAAKMIALIIEAREKFKDERSRRDYDLQLDQSKRKPEQLDPNAERLQSFMEWRNKAVSFHDEQQHDLAQSALERALSYMPVDYEDSFFFNQAALIYVDNNNCNAAMDYINKAIIIDTGNPDFYLTKGLVYNGFANGQYVNVTDKQNYYIKSEEMFLKARDLAAQKNMRVVRADAAGVLALYYNMKNNESKAEAFAQEAVDYGETWGNGKKILQIIANRREAQERSRQEALRRQEEERRRREEENRRAEELRQKYEEQKREEERRKKELENKKQHWKKLFRLSMVLYFLYIMSPAIMYMNPNFNTVILLAFYTICSSFMCMSAAVISESWPIAQFIICLVCFGPAIIVNEVGHYPVPFGNFMVVWVIIVIASGFYGKNIKKSL